MENSDSDFKSLNHKKESSLWLFTSFFAFVFLSIGTFLVSIEHNPFLAKAMVSAGFGTLSSSIILILFLSSSIRNKKIPSISESTLFRNSSLAPGVVESALNGILVNFGHLSLFIGFSSDSSNKGVISIMIVGSAILSAIYVYFRYREKLSIIEITGMLICTGGLVTIAYKSGLSGTINSFYSGFAAMSFFAVRNVLVRITEVKGLDVITNALLSTLFEAVGGLFTIIVASFWFDVFENTDKWVYPFIGGASICIGSYFLTHAIMFGKLGPAVIIANCLGIGQMMLDYVIFNITPDSVKVIGSLICLFGASLLLMGQSLVNYLKKVN